MHEMSVKENEEPIRNHQVQNDKDAESISKEWSFNYLLI